MKKIAPLQNCNMPLTALSAIDFLAIQKQRIQVGGCTYFTHPFESK